MQFTANYDFKKPGGTDLVNVDDLNTNFDNIDAALTPSADPTLVPASSGPAKLFQWVSWITNRIKAITGKDKWYEAPDTNLADIVSTATANKVLKLNGDARLPASITGDADTLDGKHADAFAPLNHTHAAPFFVKTGVVSHGNKIPKTPGYQNYEYMVSLASIDAYGSSFDISLATRGSYPNYYTVASDITRLGYVCSFDKTTLVVTAKALADNDTWVPGSANYIEIAWN